MAFFYNGTNEGEMATPYWAQTMTFQDTTSLLTDDVIQAQHPTCGTLVDHEFWWSCPVPSDMHLLPHTSSSPDSIFTPTFPQAISDPLQSFDRSTASSLAPATSYPAGHVCTASSGTAPTSHPPDVIRMPGAQLHHRKRQFECSTCNKAFRFPKDLRRHEGTHSKSKPFKCPDPTCKYHEQGFSRKDNWSRHIRREHPNINIIPPAGLVAVSTSETPRFN